VVAGESPLSSASTATSTTPEPADADGVCWPYEVVVPYWNQYDVAAPFGFTFPLTRAPLEVREWISVTGSAPDPRAVVAVVEP
jgi:hypothetical protein